MLPTSQCILLTSEGQWLIGMTSLRMLLLHPPFSLSDHSSKITTTDLGPCPTVKSHYTRIVPVWVHPW